MTTHVFGDTKPDEVSVKLPTVYDEIRSELSKPTVLEKFLVIRVKARPAFSVKFSTDIDSHKLDVWRVKARKKPGKDPIDILKFNQLVLASQTVSILYNGEDILDPDDDTPLTFHSTVLQEMLGVHDHNSALQVLFGRDAEILKAGDDVLEAAGYGTDDSDDDDPLDLEND